jgi:hypothetical protein
MFSRAFFGASYWAPRYFGDGGDLAAAAVAETPSGGWRPHYLPPGLRQREQTDEEIKAERIRMGILPPDPPPNPPVEARRALVEAQDAPGLLPYTLAAHLLPEDLAGLEALAARAAQLTMDQEIAMWLRLDQQRRLHEAWLRDEDDAAVLMLAIATLH